MPPRSSFVLEHEEKKVPLEIVPNVSGPALADNTDPRTSPGRAGGGGGVAVDVIFGSFCPPPAFPKIRCSSPARSPEKLGTALRPRPLRKVFDCILKHPVCSHWLVKAQKHQMEGRGRHPISVSATPQYNEVILWVALLVDVKQLSALLSQSHGPAAHCPRTAPKQASIGRPVKGFSNLSRRQWGSMTS